MCGTSGSRDADDVRAGGWRDGQRLDLKTVLGLYGKGFIETSARLKVILKMLGKALKATMYSAARPTKCFALTM
jgi:hypothetical protein